MTYKSAYGGLFQDPPYITTDPDPKKTDPYDKQDCIPSRYLGKRLETGALSHNPQDPDAYFDHKFLTLASAEQLDAKLLAQAEARAAREAKRHAAAEAQRKPIADHEFRYSSVPKESTGPGSYYGCFQDRPYEYMTEPWQDPKTAKAKKKRKQNDADKAAPRVTLPNIKTNPPKKGTYGVPGVLLDNPVYDDNWRATLEEREKADKKRQARAAPAPQPLGPPFRTSGVSRPYIDMMPNTGVPTCFAAYIPPEETVKGKKKKKSRKTAEQAVAVAAQATHDKPFRVLALRDGPHGCINAFPNVWVDPSEVETKGGKARRHNKLAAAAPAAERPRGAEEWKPNSFEKSSVISSCLRRFY